MIALENRFYSREEISEIVGVPVGANQFARDTKSRLKKAGYTYEWKDRRGVEILSRTPPAQRKLKKLLVKRLGVDQQTNPVDFAWFIKALAIVPGFAAMPYKTKESVLSQLCGHNVDDGTLRRWAGKLYESENAYKGHKDALWHTYTDEYGIKRQEQVEPDSAEYKHYSVLRTSQLKKLTGSGAYGTMVKILYGEHGYYYWCPAIVLNALGEDVDEIIHLVDEITHADP